MIEITSQIAEDNEIYSASVVDSATSFCMEIFHRTGHPAYIMTKPVQKWAERGS